MKQPLFSIKTHCMFKLSVLSSHRLTSKCGKKNEKPIAIETGLFCQQWFNYLVNYMFYAH